MNIFQRLATAWDAFIASLSPAEQAFIAKFESDAWGLIRTLAGVAINDVVAGGFTTASFVAAGKDVVAQGAAQGQTIAISDAMVQLNILASDLRPADPTAVPTPPAS